jgi:tetratricopeptide (TPR) repeat protein
MKKVIVVFFSALIFTGVSVAQSVEELVRQGDMLERQLKEEEAYQKFKEVIKQQPTHLHGLTRCSELASRIGRRQSTKEKQMDFYKAAKIYAERALRVNPKDSDANVAMSFAYARMSLLKSGKEKVEYVREIKNYADRALVHNPQNFKALFVIARWHYEVSNLNGMEKAAVKVFFGGLQKNSLDSAVYYYEKVKALSPEFVLNYLELAKAYHRNNKKTKAIETLNHLLRLPNTAADDPTIKSEAKQLLSTWKA